MLYIERDQFRPPHGTGKADQEQRAVARAGEVGSARSAQLPHFGSGERGRPAGRCSVLARDPAECLPDGRVLGVQWMPGDAAGACDRRDTAPKCRERVAFAGCRQVGTAAA